MRYRKAFLLIVSGFLFAGWSTPIFPQNAPVDELSDDPEVARRLMRLPDGFEAQLVASEPTIVNPLQINFDARGRLYVLCAPRYPQILPGQVPSDYVVRLEDFAADGKARKSRVVVDGLMVPTGMMPGDGGVYVGQAESLLHFREPKGNAKAEKRVLLSGFGTTDTHHTLNTFRWGPDGSLYFNQGVYIHSSVETPYGLRQLFGGGIWKLRTDRLKLEVYDRSILPNNTWGHAFDAWGQSFIASAWPGALNVVLPDSPLQRVSQPDLVPPLKLTQIGGERHCGLEIVSGRHFPEDWQGNLLTGDFLSHRVYRYALNEDGQRYHARPLPPLVVSKHRKFRPIDIKMGPDGAVYLADLYQQIIQHNQVDFRDPRRDHSRGRIWRIVRKDRPLLPAPTLAEATIEQVLDQLKAPEQWTRVYARRTLAESDHRRVSDALEKWVRELDPNASDRPRHLLEALWCCQTIDHVNRPLLTRVLRSEDARVRAAATRVLGAWSARLPDAMDALAVQVADASPRVRLEAILALCQVPTPEAVRVGMRALDQGTDPFLEFALTKLALLHKSRWQPEFQAGRLTFEGNARRTAFALKAIRDDAVPTLVTLIAKHQLPRESRAEVLQLIAALGNADQQAVAFAQTLEPAGLSVEDRGLIMDALAEASLSRKVRPSGDLKSVALFFSHDNARLGTAAIRLAGAWRLEKQRTRLNELASDTRSEDGRRKAAIGALVNLGGPLSVEKLEALCAADQTYEIRQQAIVGLTVLDLQKAARHAATSLHEAPPVGHDPGDLFAAFLARKDGSQALAKSLGQLTPASDAAKVGLRTLVQRGTPAPDLQAVLRKALGTTSDRRKLDTGQMKYWIELTQTQGDPARGEAVFRRASLGCYQCHALGGAGGRVGPDLSGIGTSAQLDYLIESVFLPSKVVREGYTTAHVVTIDGRTFSGVVARESPKELVLKDPIRDEIVIATIDIEEKRLGGSLMPDGLDQTLTDAELADLFRFLAELGKPGDYGVSHRTMARRWQYLDGIPPGFPSLDESALGKRIHEDKGLAWKPLYAKVSGDVPLGEATSSLAQKSLLLRCQLEVISPGNFTFQLNNIRGITFWMDGKLRAIQQDVAVELSRGNHTFAFRVDLASRQDRSIRLELLGSAGSRGQAKFADGK